MIPRIVILSALLLLPSCSIVQTITPSRPVAKVASNDSGTPSQYKLKANSGLLEMKMDEDGNYTGAVVTQSFVDYLSVVVKDYGDKLLPPISVPATGLLPGVTPYTDQFKNSVYFITADYLARYDTLAKWEHQGHPKTSVGVLARIKSAL